MNQRIRRGLAAAVLMSGALVALSAAPAAAHASLLTSIPAANSVLEVGPPAIVLTFDEDIEAPLSSIALFDGTGAKVEIGSPAAGDQGSVVSATVPTLTDGIYAVVWRVTSADGHVVDGAFSFQVGTAAAGDGQDLLDQVGGGGGSNSAVTWWYGVARFLALAGAIAALGGGCWSLQGSPSIGSRPAVGRLLWVGWASLMLGTLASFGLFAAQVAGGSASAAWSPSNWGDAARAHTGLMFLVRLVLGLAVGALLLGRRASSSTTWWRATGAVVGVATVVTFSASGHPNSLDPRLLWIAIDAVHLGAIVVWIGGLLALSLVGRAWMSEPEAVRPINRFSLAAAVAVPLVIATGIAQTLELAGGLDDITATDWGRMLVTKVMVVIALVGIAGVSRWMLRNDGAASIRRTVIAEAVLGIVIVGLAAGMVAQPPRAGVPSLPFDQTITANGVIASLTVTPGHVGSNEVHLLITPPGGSLTPVVSASARVLLPAADLPSAPVTLIDEGPNHYSGTVTFPRSGDWTFEIVVQITDSDSALLKATVTIP